MQYRGQFPECKDVKLKEEGMKRNTRGFSLIELLIVVAIILIIAAIAIPNLLRSRIAANQASAVGSLRTLNTAEVTYASTYNSGYAAALSYLGPPATGANPTAEVRLHQQHRCVWPNRRFPGERDQPYRASSGNRPDPCPDREASPGGLATKEVPRGDPARGRHLRSGARALFQAVPEQ